MSKVKVARWHAGWNMPGYLPETPPVCFTEWAEAHGYVFDAVHRAWDSDYDVTVGADAPTRQAVHEQVDANYLTVDTDLNTATHDKVFTSSTGDSKIVYWIEPCTVDDPSLCLDSEQLA